MMMQWGIEGCIGLKRGRKYKKYQTRDDCARIKNRHGRFLVDQEKIKNKLREYLMIC